MESHPQPVNLPNAARCFLWGLVLALLVLPFAAMQITEEVNWTTSDFIVWAGLLLLAGGAIELAARVAPTRPLFLLFVLLAIALFLGSWAQLAVDLL